MTTYNLGRDFDTPIPIEDKHASVSHNHASITIDGDKWILCDNDSANGTYIEVDGVFRRCKKMRVTPNTWIRLGEQGHRGYYLKARRVVRPNDYREDFAELYEIFQQLEKQKTQLESQRRRTKYITPILVLVCLVLTCFIHKINEDPMLPRIFIFLPGFFSPIITDQIMVKSEKKVKQLQKELICPKCRRTLGRDDIINREHLFCHAH